MVQQQHPQPADPNGQGSPWRFGLLNHFVDIVLLLSLAGFGAMGSIVI